MPMQKAELTPRNATMSNRERGFHARIKNADRLLALQKTDIPNKLRVSYATPLVIVLIILVFVVESLHCFFNILRRLLKWLALRLVIGKVD